MFKLLELEDEQLINSGPTHIDVGPDGSIYLGIGLYDLYNYSSKYDINIRKYTPAFGEEWSIALAGWNEDTNSYEVNDAANAFMVDQQGDLYVAGYSGGKFDTTDSKDNKNAFVIKLDSSGSREFVEYLGSDDSAQFRLSSNKEVVNSLTVANDGSVIITGTTAHREFEGKENPKPGQKSIFLTKLSNDGDQSWTNLLSGDFLELAYPYPIDIAERVKIDNAGGIYIAGTTTSPVFGGNTNPSLNSGDESIFLTKLSTDGVVEWTQLVDSSGSDVFYDLAIDDNNDIYISGVKDSIRDELGMNSSFIAKYSSAGELQWDEYLINQSGGSRWSTRESMLTISSDGEIYVAAQFGVKYCSPGNMPLIDQNYISYCSASILQKWSPDGDKEWTQSLSHESADDGLSVDDIDVLDDQIYMSGYASQLEAELGNSKIYKSSPFIATFTDTVPTPVPVPTPTQEPTPTPVPPPTPEPSPEPIPTNETKQLRGTEGNDKLKANSLNVSIDGMGGNDKIIGSNGDDTLSGGLGNDKIKGKKGSDSFICLYGKDTILGYNSDEGDTIEVSGDFTISKRKKKHSMISHEEGTVLVKKTSPEEVIVNSGISSDSSTTNSVDYSKYLTSAKQSQLPSREGDITGTDGDDIIDVQRYYNDAYIFDELRIGNGSDILVFDKTPTFKIKRKGNTYIEKLSSATYWLSEFDPLTGDKLLFDSNAFTKYDNILATASSMKEVFEVAQTSTTFIRYNDYLYYNENGASQGLSITTSEDIHWWDAMFILFDEKNQNLKSLAQAIEII